MSPKLGNFKLMYLDCVTTSVKRPKWLPEHVFVVVCFVEMLVSEDYLYDNNVKESC